MAVSKAAEGEKGGQLYGGGRAVGEVVAGEAVGEGELVEGLDGEWRRREG